MLKEKGITMNEKDNLEPQEHQADITGNGTSTDNLPDSNGEVHTSELSPTEQEYIDYSNDIDTLITEIQTVNQRLDTMTNISIVGMIGIGLVVGILACNIFARYFNS